MTILRYLLLCLNLASISLATAPLTIPLTNTQGLNFNTIASSGFGYSVSKAGDINGDGIDDVIIGAPYENSNAGAVYVIYGSKTGLTDLSATSLGALSSNNKGFKIRGVAGGELGTSVSYAGDMNKDGVGDIVIGAPNLNTGTTYIIFGKTSGLSDMTLTHPSNLFTSSRGFTLTTSAGGDLGRSVSYAGDLNRDGFADIIVGAPNRGVWNYGSAYIIYGRPTSDLTDIDMTNSIDLVTPRRGFKVDGSFISWIGYSVSYGGDINHDGIDDAIAGASGNAEYVAVIYGSSTTTLTDIDLSTGLTALSSVNRGFVIKANTGNEFAEAVSGAGDLNGDGIDDIIIGIPDEDYVTPSISEVGFALVIYGKDGGYNDIDFGSILSPSPSQGFRITHGQANAHLGRFVKKVGDFNGDGISDFAIAASGNNASPYGAIYVVYGSKTGLTNLEQVTPATFTVTNRTFVISPVSSANAVNCAGDFNGDGGQDIIFGSPSTGSAYILFGTPPPIVPDVVDLTIVEEVTEVLSSATGIASLAATSAIMLDFKNPGSILLTTMLEGIYFIKFLNITYPPRLEYFLENYEPVELISIDFLSSPPEFLTNNIEEKPIPAKFEKYEDQDFHSSFLVNFYPSLIPLLIVTVLIIITFLFGSCNSSKFTPVSTSGRVLKWMCTRLRQTVKWNLMMSLLMGDFGDVSIFTSLEFRTAVPVNELEVVSFVLCLLMNIAVVFVEAKSIHVVWELQKAQTQSQKTKDPQVFEAAKNKLENFEVFFDTFKHDTFLKQSFLFFSNLRMYVFYAAISWLDHSLVQTILNTVIGLVMLLYVLILRPLTGKVDLAQFILTEIVFFLVNVSTLALSITEIYDVGNKGTRAMFGDLIIICSAIFMGIALIFLFISLISTLRDVYVFLKEFYSQRYIKSKASVHPSHPSDLISNQPEISQADDLSVIQADNTQDLNSSTLALNDVPPADMDSSVIQLNRNRNYPVRQNKYNKDRKLNLKRPNSARREAQRTLRRQHEEIGKNRPDEQDPEAFGQRRRESMNERIFDLLDIGIRYGVTNRKTMKLDKETRWFLRNGR